MPTNHTHISKLSARLAGLAVEVQGTVDQLLGERMCDAEAEVWLTPGVVLLSQALDDLEDALYRAAKLDQGHQVEHLAVARILAGSSR